MAGGLLNLIAIGNQNIILNGNPVKSFFKTKYSKYTNFGLQKFRIDFEKERQLSLINETEIDFKIPRHGDLLYDTFICLTMPNIYSTLYYDGTNYVRYEFQWIKNLGVSMIRDIQITSNGITLAKYSGEYLHCLSHRDLIFAPLNKCPVFAMTFIPTIEPTFLQKSCRSSACCNDVSIGDISPSKKMFAP